MAEKQKRIKLKKSMGPGAIWAVAVGSIIGWGCFIQGAVWTERAGGPLPLFLGFFVGGLLMVVIGYSYSYMIAKFPVAGGEFAYAYKGFGRVSSYVCGWMLSLGYLSIVALNATALPVLASYLFPGVFTRGYMYTVAGYDVYAGEVALSVFFIVLFGIMNYRGAKSVGNLQLIMVLIMCAAVVVSIAGTVVTGNFEAANLSPAYGQGKSFGGGFLSILALAPFLYVGFDCIPQAAEEYDFPPQKSKMLIISALIVGSLIYGAMALVTDTVIPWQDVLSLTDSTGTLVKWHTGAILEMAMGKIGVGFVAIAVCMGIFTGMNGFFMTSSRLIFGMARAKMLPSLFGKVHKKYNTPHTCIIFTMIVCCICPFFGREVISWVVDMCSVGTAFGYFFTCAGAFILLKKYGDPNDDNKIHPAVALAGCMISIAILLLLVIPGSPAFMAPQSFIALIIWVLMGTAFYFASRKNFVKITKREMDYLILGNVQVIRHIRAGQESGAIIQANVVEPNNTRPTPTFRD
ncbi:MAG: APC family permease [Lachnospiraceae bacterium]|nr:APC family permease [Lachnospiraceae bacterium]